MSTVEFVYNNSSITINCIKNESLEKICKRFLKKYFITNEKLIFYYSGKKIDLKSIYSETINETDKKNKTMKIEIYENQKKCDNDYKYSHIICPKCSENCKFSLEDYKINLYDCPNNHKIDNISIEEFNKTQNINENKIKCSNCNDDIAINLEENKIYFCTDCKKNLCDTCKLKHNNTHYIINYGDKNYICKEHNRSYDSFCNNCKKNICIICYSSHENHDIKSFGYMIPNLSKYSNDLKQLGNIVDNFENNINDIINKLTKVKINANKYQKIFSDIINNFNYRQINYEILFNLNNINTNTILKDFSNINNENHILNKFRNIMKIYEKMFDESIIVDEKNDIQNIKDNFYDLKMNGVNQELNISKDSIEILDSLNKAFDSYKKKSKKKRRYCKRKKNINENGIDNDNKNINNTLDNLSEDEKDNSEDEKDEINFYENNDEDKKYDDNLYSQPNNSFDNEEFNKYLKINSNRQLKKNRKIKNKNYGNNSYNEQ